MYDDYIPLNSLSANTKYHIYIRYGSEVKYLSRTTYAGSAPGRSAISGKIAGYVDGAATSYSYTITFPENYGKTNEKWPFWANLKTSSPSGPNFPCVVFYIDVHSGNKGDWLEIDNIKSTIRKFVENPKNHIDLERIYCSGYSAGGCASMLIANEDTSDRYDVKAILMEGTTNWLKYHCENLGNVDIWSFYGQNDSLRNTEIIDTLNALSGDGEHKQTIMPNIGHSMGPVLDSPHTIMWMLAN